ncbi:MAG: hypothetical protein PHP32_02980 [Candidatus Izemoplasmatales bacterium]|nr:hypothetical protein [Candidatus Izemoplasmatales bacterium]
MNPIRNKIGVLLFLAVLVGFLIPSVSADMGPKPTAYITIIGVEEPYYFDLLVEKDTCPLVLTAEEVEEQIDVYYYTDTFPEELNGYCTEDHYASYTLYSQIPHTIRTTENENEFYIGYFAPPEVFRIAIVTENGIIISDVMTRTLFNATFTFDVSNLSMEPEDYISGVLDANEADAHETLPVWQVLVNTAIAVVLTLLIELGLLYLVGYREKHTYKVALYVNLATQIVLNLLLWYGFYGLMSIFGYFFVLILGEFVVFIIEMIAFQKLFKERKWFKPIPYAILANFLSMIIGILMLATPFK